jgi:hypothetical protein
MDYTIISSNLNTWGNTGRYETDASTWSFGGGGSDWGLSRSNGTTEPAFEGTYSAKVIALTDDPITTFRAIRARPSAWISGRTYLAKSRVYVPTATPIAADDYVFKIGISDVGAPELNILEENFKTVLEAKDSWVEVEVIFNLGAVSGSFINTVNIDIVPAGGGAASPIAFGTVFFDLTQIFEINIIEATCDLVIDVAGTVVTDESAAAANDGSITVAVTGGDAPFEYSKNGGDTWQSSNLFTGLAPDVYNIVVREQGNPSCNDAQSFAVNAFGASSDFDFSTSVTNETVLGAANGIIEVTVTGTGGPFTFSKNGGADFQGSNIFNNLAPGTYTIVVKDASDNVLAKNVTVLPGLAVFDDVYLSKNPITHLTTASSAWIAEENFRNFIDVRVEDVAGSGVFISKMKQKLVPDAANQTLFYLRRAFQGVLRAVAPAVNESTIKRLTDRIKLFRVFRGSVTGDQEEPSSYTASNPYLVLLGGIDKLRFPQLNYLKVYLPGNKKFLTWAPKTKTVERTQTDFLNFWVYGVSDNTLKLQITAFYDDNTSQVSVTKTITGVQYAQLYQIPAGPQNSGVLNINEEKNLIKYDLKLLNQSDAVISEVRSYTLEEARTNSRYFMFLNSLGAYEVLRFTGSSMKKVSVDKRVIEKFLPHNYEASAGQFKMRDVLRRNMWEFSTGFLKGEDGEAWFDYMQDFLQSSEVFLLQGNTKVPVIIEPGDFDLKEDYNYEYYVRFTALSAYEEDVFTAELT